MGATERQKTGSWVTGCPQTHGNAAVDAERGFLFVGCLAKAKVAVLDIAQAGAHLDEYELGPGAFLPAYSSTLRHLYVRGDPGMPIAILGVDSTGKLTQLETIDSIEKAHCLTADDRKHFWTCDWAGGALIRFSDSHPATAR